MKWVADFAVFQRRRGGSLLGLGALLDAEHHLQLEAGFPIGLLLDSGPNPDWPKPSLPDRLLVRSPVAVPVL